MILDTIKAQASGILLAAAVLCGFFAGWTLARYIDAIESERIAAIALNEKINRDKVVIAKQQELIAYQAREAAQKRKALEDKQNAQTIIDNLMRDADERVRVVSIERICGGGLPASDTPASAISPTGTVFERYDAGLAELERLTKQAVRACELDRESVIQQAGGR